MSLHIEYRCDKCNFEFLGGYGVEGLFNQQIIELRSICISCFTEFPIYSEDLKYPEVGKLCFLHPNVLTCEYEVFDKAEKRAWQRRIKRAGNTEKKKLKRERKTIEETESLSRMTAKVQSGIKLAVEETVQKGLAEIRIGLAEINCPTCGSNGAIVLGFQQGELCPKCKQGHISCPL